MLLSDVKVEVIIGLPPEEPIFDEKQKKCYFTIYIDSKKKIADVYSTSVK